MRSLSQQFIDNSAQQLIVRGIIKVVAVISMTASFLIKINATAYKGEMAGIVISQSDCAWNSFQANIKFGSMTRMQNNVGGKLMIVVADQTIPWMLLYREFD